jgi:hypothetical protein
MYLEKEYKGRGLSPFYTRTAAAVGRHSRGYFWQHAQSKACQGPVYLLIGTFIIYSIESTFPVLHTGAVRGPCRITHTLSCLANG